MIREAQLRDAHFIFGLGEQAFSKYGGHGGKACLAGLEHPGSVAFISEHGIIGGPVGFAVSQWSGDSAYLQSIAVLPELRRQGFAKALLKECIKRMAIRAGAENFLMWLHVAELNAPAMALFENLGFEVQRNLPSSKYKVSGEWAIPMSKIIQVQDL
jgi:ribosomal protein S18 acetylase RimI-like enzyme